jgi:hypothetical protein
MEAMRDHWTDDRMDELARRMDEGFNRVHMDLRDLRHRGQGDDLRAEMAEQGKDLRSEMAELGKDLRAETAELGSSLRAEMAAMHRMMFGFCSAMLAALIGLAALLATQA